MREREAERLEKNSAWILAEGSAQKDPDEAS